MKKPFACCSPTLFCRGWCNRCGVRFAEEVVVIAPSAPPAVRYEAVPAPRVGYVWDHGHWRWDHGRYVWAAGHWQAERVGYHWVPGHWVARGANGAGSRPLGVSSKATAMCGAARVRPHIPLSPD